MVDPKSDSEACCPVGRCAEILGGKWTLLVVRDLCDGPRHFGELERSLQGISPRTLCDRLRLLSERGLVSRTYIKALPPRTLYQLTDAGHRLAPLIEMMRELGSLMPTPLPDQEMDLCHELAETPYPAGEAVEALQDARDPDVVQQD